MMNGLYWMVVGRWFADNKNLGMMNLEDGLERACRRDILHLYTSGRRECDESLSFFR